MTKPKGNLFGLQHCWNLLEGLEKLKTINDDGGSETGRSNSSSLKMDDREDDDGP